MEQIDAIGFKTVEEAIALANDTAYGLGAGVWTRSGNTAYRLGRAIEAGRLGFEADPMPPRDMAAPSTPVLGMGLLA